jgi:murein DD-endopeptidase MepM/ murein hydrolase activator NlpD
MPALFAALLLLASATPAAYAHAAASTASTTPEQDAIQSQIDTTQQQIDSLKNEIEQLQIQLTNTTKQKQTLQSAVQALDLNIKKIQKSITLTNAQMVQTDRQISLLGKGISTTTTSIGQAQEGVGATLRDIAELDQEPIAASVLTGGTLSNFFNQVVALGAVRDDLQGRVRDLSALKSTLQTNKNTAQQSRNRLASLQVQLTQQKQSLAIARQSQNDLLAETKNQESSYQALIADKQLQEARFEQDLLNFQAKLGLRTDASTLPASGSAPLAWPLASVRITQYFGNTPFATKNPQIYSGHGHTGVDFAASPGTPVLAARGGIVLGTGNTDLTCPNASFGKWVFVKHDDGLSTLYAHLSVISVATGQSVSTGQVVGYSGSTGYATGPHLHFGVYASSGSEIASFASSSCHGRTYTMPVGDLSAYLNPLSYLPAH